MTEGIFLDDTKNNLAVLETGRQSFYIELYISGADHKVQQGAGKKILVFHDCTPFFAIDQ